MASNAHGLTLLAVLALGACSSSGADEPEAPPAETAATVTPASHTDSTVTASGATAAVAAHTDSLRGVIADSLAADSLAADSAPTRPEVVRETFAYAGGPRDPFSSLLTMERMGPEFVDLQLVGVYHDLQYPSNSVAIIRDKVGDRRYKVRAGDELGSMRVREIRDKEVVISVQDFGYSRQEILSLRKQEDVTP